LGIFGFAMMAIGLQTGMYPNRIKGSADREKNCVE
jgi:hypothetical protein